MTTKDQELRITFDRKEVDRFLSNSKAEFLLREKKETHEYPNIGTKHYQLSISVLEAFGKNWVYIEDPRFLSIVKDNNISPSSLRVLEEKDVVVIKPDGFNRFRFKLTKKYRKHIDLHAGKDEAYQNAKRLMEMRSKSTS